MKRLIILLVVLFVSAQISKSQIINMEFGGVDFRVMDARVIGDELRVYFDLINKVADEEMSLHLNASDAYAVDGSVFSPVRGIVAGVEHRGVSSVFRTKMIKNVPTKVVIIYKGDAAKVDSLVAVKMKITLPKRENPTKLEVKLVKIPVKQQDLSNPLEPFEIEENIFVDIDDLKQEGSKLLVNYKMFSTKGDQKIEMKCRHRVIDGNGVEYNASSCGLGNKKEHGSGVLRTKLMQDIPIKGFFEFDLKGKKIDEIALIELDIFNNSFNLRSVPIQ